MDHDNSMTFSLTTLKNFLSALMASTVYYIYTPKPNDGNEYQLVQINQFIGPEGFRIIPKHACKISDESIDFLKDFAYALKPRRKKSDNFALNSIAYHPQSSYDSDRHGYQGKIQAYSDDDVTWYDFHRQQCRIPKEHDTTEKEKQERQTFFRDENFNPVVDIADKTDMTMFYKHYNHIISQIESLIKSNIHNDYEIVDGAFLISLKFDDEACKAQGPHTDYGPPFGDDNITAIQNGFFLLACIFAIEDFEIIVYPFTFTTSRNNVCLENLPDAKTVSVKKGEFILFRGDLVHSGAAFGGEKNARLHFYINVKINDELFPGSQGGDDVTHFIKSQNEMDVEV